MRNFYKKLNNQIFFKWIFTLLLFWPAWVFAWQHGVLAGYGIPASEIDADYNTYGYYLEGILFRTPPLDRALLFTVNTSIGRWYAETPQHNVLTAVALSGAFRGYFVPLAAPYVLHPYLLASIGPSYLNERRFGANSQGSHLAFKINLGVGTEIGQGERRFDVNLRLMHFCNAGLVKPNEGYDVVYVLSVGYLF